MEQLQIGDIKVTWLKGEYTFRWRSNVWSRAESTLVT